MVLILKQNLKTLLHVTSTTYIKPDRLDIFINTLFDQEYDIMHMVWCEKQTIGNLYFISSTIFLSRVKENKLSVL